MSAIERLLKLANVVVVGSVTYLVTTARLVLNVARTVNF